MRFREYLITEGYDFSSTQINFDEDLSKKFMEWSKKNIPDELLDKQAGGREDNFHVTVKYGLHTKNPKNVEEVIKKYGKSSIDVFLKNMSLFNSEKYDVLKVDVESKDLVKLNKMLSDNLKHTDTYPTYKPHMTIAYLKKGKGDNFIGNSEFSGKNFTSNKIIFSGQDERQHEIKL